MVGKNLTLCALPFIHLATHPNGLVSPCCSANFENGLCFSKTKGTPLVLGKNSIESIMNSESFIELRRKMIEGKRPTECVMCYFYEDGGVSSKRDKENEKYLDKVVVNERLQDVQFKFIELRLGNTCNLKCLTCNPMSSSRWMEDVKEFDLATITDDHYNFLKYESRWFEDEKWYDELLTHCNELEEIYINGGEPTLIPKHFDFLEKLINADRAKNITLIYNINGTHLPTRFVDLLHKFKKVKIKLSIDDLGRRNKYIRYPSDWNTIMNNYETLKNSPFEVSITQTISIFNVCNVYEFYKFFENERIEYNFVTFPEFLAIRNLDPLLKVHAVDQIEKLPENSKLKFQVNMTMEFDKELFKKSINFITMMDKIRNTNIKDYLEEYAHSSLF